MRKQVPARAFALFAVAILGLTTSVAVARADDDVLVDVGHAIDDLQKKIDDARSHGRWGRDGKLSRELRAACGADQPQQRFMAWGDQADYVPMPGGDMEQEGSWKLGKGAHFETGNSPYSAGNRSLFLSHDGAATSAVMCVSEAHPTIRCFAATTGGPDATLGVEVSYEDLGGAVKKLKIANLRADDEWRPTVSIPLHVNIRAGASDDGVAAIALTFKAKAKSSKTDGWKIDDCFVDPIKVW